MAGAEAVTADTSQSRPATTGNHVRHRADVELARIVGAGLVFWYHYAGLWNMKVVHRSMPPVFEWLLARAGSAGVTVFLVLTAMLSFRAVCLDHTGSWREFITRRYRGVFPYYWFVAIPLILVAWAAGAMPITDFVKVPFWLLGLGFLSPSLLNPVVLSWWYMSLALQLMLVLPAIGWLWRRFGAIATSAGLVAITVGLTPLLSNHFGVVYTKALVVTRLIEVLAGLLLAALTVSGHDRRLSRTEVVATSGLLLAGLLAMHLLSAGAEQDAHTVGIVVVVLIVVSWRALGVQLDRIAQPVIVLGSLTFGFFLIHGPVLVPAIGLARRFGAYGFVIGGCLAIGITLALTIGSRIAFQALTSRLGRSGA